MDKLVYKGLGNEVILVQDSVSEVNVLEITEGGKEGSHSRRGRAVRNFQGQVFERGGRKLPRKKNLFH